MRIRQASPFARPPPTARFLQACVPMAPISNSSKTLARQNRLRWTPATRPAVDQFSCHAGPISSQIHRPPAPCTASRRTHQIFIKILFFTDFTSPQPALDQDTSHASIKDLTIFASDGLHVVSLGFVFRERAGAERQRSKRSRRIRVRASAFRVHMDVEAHRPAPSRIFSRMLFQKPRPGRQSE